MKLGFVLTLVIFLHQILDIGCLDEIIIDDESTGKFFVINVKNNNLNSFPHSKPITFKKIYFSACLKNTECPDDRPTCIAGICSG